MADTPIPRSYEQIVSDIVDSFIARTGISALKVGSPILSMIEAVAQSQMRNSQDTFNLLASQSLDHATGDALTQIAADEGLVRKNASASFGYVTFTDNAFTKVSTQLTAGASRGQNFITVNDITGFAQNDSIIIGNEVRVISNVSGNTLTLTGTLSAVYSIGTEVVKSQGNARTIPAGTSVGTGTINFTTVNSATIPAGYTSVANVSVVCATEGTTGNVPASTINVINSTLTLTKPTVTNPYGFINGQDQETDDELRDRVRYARRNKQKGTPQAIQNAAIGVQSPVASGESKKVISASVADTGVGKASLYIDDGTGYEPITSPIGIETLTAFATGGERCFELQGGRPVAKCYIESELTFPTDLSSGGSVTVKVGAYDPEPLIVPSTVFADSKNATSYELVSFINSQYNLKFAAATRDNHTKVILYPKSDDDNTITVTAQARLGFATGYPVSTLYLFRNGVLQTEGATEDYTLNRYKGQIFLNTELARGESLVVGSVDIRTGIITNPLSNTGTFNNQYIWLVPDDDAVGEPKAFLTKDTVVEHTYVSGTKLLTLTCSTNEFTSVAVNDWVIIWDSSFGVFWTKRVHGRTNNSITVEANADLSLGDKTIVSDGGLVVYRTTKTPQPISVPTYTDLDNLVSQISAQFLQGISVRRVSVDQIGFYTESYRSYPATTGGIRFLTGTPTVSGLFGFSSSSEKYNPTYYQTSLISNSETSSVSNFGVSVVTDNDIEKIGKISLFVNGEQKGLRTVQLNSGKYRHTLNDNLYVSTDERDLYAGFHISDTDSLSVVVDGDTAKAYSLSMSIPAKINVNSITDPNGQPLDFLNHHTVNDWAIWSLSSQGAQPFTGEDQDIVFASKLYGPRNLIRKIEYVYPTEPLQAPAYSIGNTTLMKVVLPSGVAVTPIAKDSTQKLWAMRPTDVEDINTTLVFYKFKCMLMGTPTFGPNNGICKVRVSLQEYVGIGEDFVSSPNSFLRFADYDRTFSVTGLPQIEGEELVFDILDPDHLIPSTGRADVYFSVSNNSNAVFADFSNVVSGDLLVHNPNPSTKLSYRISSINNNCIVLRTFTPPENLAWYGSDVSFIKRNLTTDTFVENPYFTMNPSSGIVVEKATDDLLDFDLPAIYADGNVNVDYALDYVGETSPFVSKTEDITHSQDLVTLIPVTAKNVADWLNYNLSVAGVLASVDCDGKIELARVGGGSSSSVSVSGGSANSYSASITTIASSGATSCVISSNDASHFVVGANAYIYSESDPSYSPLASSVKIESITLVTDTTSRVNFESAPFGYPNQGPYRLVAWNKLGFPENTPATNSDGYKYYSGLLGEVNKVIYGDPTDPVSYPGYASANANIEVTAPQVKQVFLNIFVRMQSGFTLSEAKLAIRNAAAAAVNATPVGQDVAYSDVISAVNALNGVFAVAIEDNTTSNPTIPVLSFEKPLIIDLEKDINVTITGI